MENEKIADKKMNYTICLIRIIACLLIVWNHTSGHMLNGWGNPLLWANIGVQIFFFMSGYLYAGRKIGSSVNWLKKQLKKICLPYWIYLLFILPIIAILAPGSVTVVKAAAAWICIQGFGFTIEGIGQHWFVTYIIICYLITAFILNRIDFDKSAVQGGNLWILFAAACIIGQAVTIPLALTISFKAAYIFTYIAGYVYGVRFKKDCEINQERIKEKKLIDIILYIISVIGIFVRIYLDMQERTGIFEAAADLAVQWIKLIQGAAVFVFIYNLIPNKCWSKMSNKLKKVLAAISKYTFEVYIVHEFFTCTMFTQFINAEGAAQVIAVWGIIILACLLLAVLEKAVKAVFRRIRHEQSNFLG